MDEAGCQHCTGCADRMPVGDRAAFDIDDVGRKPELARDGDDDRGEGLVDLDALDIAEPPPRSVERLTDGRDRPEAEHAGLDRGNAIGDEARDRWSAQFRSASTTAAAPLFMPGALPAVIVPSLLNAGLRPANASS